MESKWSPITKLENPKATIKTEDWLGKEPNQHKSKMERRLNKHNMKKNVERRFKLK